MPQEPVVLNTPRLGKDRAASLPFKGFTAKVSATAALALALSLPAAAAPLYGTKAEDPPSSPATSARPSLPVVIAKLDSARERAADLVLTSLAFIGTPYTWGGTSVDTGFDCSGFVRDMYHRALGLVLPRLAYDQAQASEAIPTSDLQPGDLVFYNTLKRRFSHVGIYLGSDKFIHAPKPGAYVRVEDMRASYWQQRFNGARRLLAQPREPS
jgi:cell wall-associated NlpC family hydrolase